MPVSHVGILIVMPAGGLILTREGEPPMSGNYARSAIVTGATSGIGEATVRKFIAAGFGVVGNGRNAAKLISLEKEMGPAFYGVAGDAADNTVLERLFASAIERFGKAADIVVANAGRGLPGSVKDSDLAHFEDVLRINVSGTLALLQKAAQRMVKAQQDAYPKSAADIVIIGSVVGRHISPFGAVYGASKFAVHALAEGLRREVGPKGVRVSLVEPGVVLSGFQAAAGYSDEMVQGFHEKFGPLLMGDDVANAILYIVSQPPHVHISDIVVRPTGQDYP
jgi:NADP-dependent 3-hydroxy acid dehydrogenase YdfG